MDAIRTIITFNISDEGLYGEFTAFLEKECMATHDEDQSTYISPMDREDIRLLLASKSFTYGVDDFVTLYYCWNVRTANQSLPLNKLEFIPKNKKKTNI